MSNHAHDAHVATIDQLPRETAGLPEAARPEVVELSDGDAYELEIAPVAKRIGDVTVRMLAYNGSIPGPTLKVPQGSTVMVHVTNHGMSRRPCIGTGSASRTATTAHTTHRHRFRSEKRSRIK